MNNGRDCEHGSQVGKCYICDLVDAENRISELEKEVSIALKLNYNLRWNIEELKKELAKALK
jgi:hypothetical protein